MSVAQHGYYIEICQQISFKMSVFVGNSRVCIHFNMARNFEQQQIRNL